MCVLGTYVRNVVLESWAETGIMLTRNLVRRSLLTKLVIGVSGKKQETKY